MPRGKHFSDIEQAKIKAFKQCGKSNRWIAKELGRDSRAIDRFVKNMDNYGKKIRKGIPP
jgi:IS30 family transposase